MPGAPVTAATFGMAGVIYPAATGSRPDERWLAGGFRTTPTTVQAEWRGDDMVAVTFEHGPETGQPVGVRRHAVPTVGEHAGVVFGQLFEQPARAERPGSVAEALLAAFGRHGATAFRSINGGWAGVVWDRGRQEAHFVRDSVGSHPMYAARLPDRIVFSTDLRVLRAAGLLGPVDEDAAAQFLRFLYVPPPRTINQGVLAVHAGHVLTMGRSVEQRRYAAPRFVETPMRGAPASEQEIAEHLPAFEERLLTAVSDCLPATGRVAVSLSGGQDSATLAVALAKLCPDRVLAFTVGERDPRLSEAHHAALVCRAVGLTHEVYVPTDEDIARGIRAFAHEHDQPIGDLAAFAYYLGMAQLPDDCTLILDGSGNDDYFGITGTALELRYTKRAALQKFVPDALWPVVPWLMARGPAGFRSLSRHWSRPIEESFVPWEGWSPAELTELFGRPISMEDTHLWTVMRRSDPTRWRAALTEVVGGIWEAQAGFAKGVHFAHALGRGMRYPFIDERMAAWVHQLPMELKLDKVILKAYMARNLPAEIVDKPKSGFIFDLNRLFFNPVLRWADDLDRRGALRALPGWSDRPIRRVLEAHAQSPSDLRWQHRLYALCLLAAVLEAPPRDA